MSPLRLAHDLYCLDHDPVTDDGLKLPEGTLIRNARRVGEPDEFGVDWTFEASTDAGRTWARYTTILNPGDPFPAINR